MSVSYVPVYIPFVRLVLVVSLAINQSDRLIDRSMCLSIYLSMIRCRHCTNLVVQSHSLFGSFIHSRQQ